MSASTNHLQPRQLAQVNPRLDKSLAAYMLAAGAAGVSLLAAQPAEAEIVYTPANIAIGPRTSFLLDLNNDGINDFLISNWQYGQASHLGINQEAPADGVLGRGAALPAGVRVGPKGAFVGYGTMAFQDSVSGISFYDGPWKDAHNRYLGLKFSINGETHYGWARLTVTAKRGIFATLTGYAYETVPNKTIIAGKTSGAEVASAVNPKELPAPARLSAKLRSATVDMLARGAEALAIWRRDEGAAVSLG
jgi:hypothetical protein